MLRILKALKNLHRLVTTAGALLAAVVVAVETYQALKKKVGGSGSS